MAVLYGIIASIVIGLISGLGLPFTDATLPTIGAGLSGLLAGGVAGYYASEGVGSGALHGLLATTIGGLIAALFLLVIGTLAAGIFGFGAGIALLILVIATGIPGAVGGALGGMLRPKEQRMGRPAA
ncbi:MULTISPECIES: DUF5518 domain-containing protein [unclassified Haladaptatus]|uniref:DUF5518 domain-containing protein n=1 Tax=unclassified Haladaptatus TaxID=2622732 RepID=UPI0023E79331|nr:MULTISPECIES: DUF5518 domain-containing protein [unclassified Haladaptatus]